MLNALKENKITTAVLILGYICALLLCIFRIGIEARDNSVCVVMSTSDMARIDGKLDGIREFDGTAVLDGVPLLIEDEVQYSYVEEYTPNAAGRNEAMARCFYLYPQFASRYNYLGYPGAEEIENILYRAATDRNIRVLWLTPFVDAETGEIVTDFAVYNDVVSGLSARLERQGLSLGDDFSVISKYEPSPLLLLGTAFGVAAAGVLLLLSIFKLRRGAVALLTAVCMALCAALWYFDRLTGHFLFVPLLAFAAAVIFPCLALWYMTDRLSKIQGGSLSHELGVYCGILFMAVGTALDGGLIIAALQSSSNYLLAITNFSGVKLSQILPVAFAVFVVLRYLCPPREILEGKKFILVLAVLALVLGVGYYILRTGNANVGIFEQRFRNWLENLLIARPRTKEFLVAWPCLAVAAALAARGKLRYAWPFAILTSAGFASVVNTFCHSRAPVWLSLTRSLLGALIGTAIGLLIIFIAHKKPAAD